MAIHATAFRLEQQQAAQLPRGHRRGAHGVADLDGEGADRRHSELHRKRAASVINEFPDQDLRPSRVHRRNQRHMPFPGR